MPFAILVDKCIPVSSTTKCSLDFDNLIIVHNAGNPSLLLKRVRWSFASGILDLEFSEPSNL